MVRSLIVSPLLAIPVIVYGLIATIAGSDGANERMQAVVFGMSMFLGER